jgi:preprotein translocase subunit SecG
MNHWIFVALVVLHIFVCVLLILLILIQNDKGGGLAGAFGGMGGGAAFTGSSAATFLTRLTQWAAAASFVLLLGLNYLSTKGIDSNHKESELKSARRGLSSVLPAAGMPVNVGAGGASAIPGLGAAPEGAKPVAPAGATTPPTGSSAK